MSSVLVVGVVANAVLACLLLWKVAAVARRADQASAAAAANDDQLTKARQEIAATADLVEAAVRGLEEPPCGQGTVAADSDDGTTR